MAPEVAYLLARSLRTLVVRVNAHNAAAQILAERLVDHPRINKVNYPGLPDFIGYNTAKNQMREFGGMISFVINGNAKETADVVDRLKLFTNCPKPW